MTAKRRQAAALLVLALIAATQAGGAARAAEPRGAVKLSALPTWVHEAAQREGAGEDDDLVWLHQETIVEPLRSGGVRVTRRRAGRALRAAMLDEVGNFSVYYVEGDSIESLRGWSLPLEGKPRRAHAKDDVIDESGALTWENYNDKRLRTIRAPGLTVGAIAAHESVVVRQLDTGARTMSFGDADHRTLSSRLVLRVPDGWDSEAIPVRAERIEIRSDTAGFVAEAQDLLPLPREELAPPATRRLPMVWAHWWSPDGTRGYRDWRSVGRWYYELSEPVLDQAGEAAEISRRLRPAEPTDLKRAIAESFEFASQKVRYVSIDVGLGLGAGYKPSTPESVCRKRFGDCKDKSFLLRAIVGPWGLKHYPVLVRTRDLGPLVDAVPTPGQFNHCIAAIALPPGVGESFWSTVEVEGLGRLLLLDPTVSTGSAWDLPPAVQGTRAFVVHDEGGELLELPVQPTIAGRSEIELEARLDSKGEIVEARLVEIWNGNAASRIRSSYAGMSESTHRDRVLRNLQERFPGTAVSDYEISGLDEVDEPVVEITSLTGGRLGKRVGDLLILEPGKLGFGILGVTLPSPPRSETLDTGMPREERVRVILEVAEDWIPEELPQGQSLRTADLEFDSEWTRHERLLVYQRDVRLLAREIPTDRYAEFRDSVTRVNRADAEAVVLVAAAP